MDIWTSIVINLFYESIHLTYLSFQYFLALPLPVLLLVLIFFFLFFYFVIIRPGFNKGAVLIFCLMLFLLAGILIIKIAYRTDRLLNDTGAPLLKNGSLENLFFDENKVRQGLKKIFPRAEMVVEPQHPAVEYILIKNNIPKEVRIHVAVINLKYHGLQICITPALERKRLLSDFAGGYGCVVAINGEAGFNWYDDPSADFKADLGEWTGDWIVKGNPVLLTDVNKRPLIGFDLNNKARYYPQKLVDSKLSPEKYNTIWGRYDMIVDSQIATTFPNDLRDPRTGMGINESGDKLVLMVVDGRQPGYSMGLDRRTMAQVMLLFGVKNSMFCDQGGSSEMYLKSKNGPVNRPSDGQERPLYCHFGVAFK